jgi:predicted Zn-dependent protease
VRFARWDEILQAEAPPADLPYARGIWHYARGRAHAARGAVDSARAELDQLQRAAADLALQDAAVEFNAASDILAIAADVLAGHVAAAGRDWDAAVARLSAAAEREDGLVYGEPPEWSVPVRQELGAVLLAAGRAQEAERAFREDLDRFPDNGWSLAGLARSLDAQGRSAEAATTRRSLEDAWSSADVPVPGAER